MVGAIGAWGVRWIGELGDADLDPKLLMWDLHRNVDPDPGPARSDGGRRSSSPTLPGQAPVLVAGADPGGGRRVRLSTPATRSASRSPAGCGTWSRSGAAIVDWPQALRSGAVTLQGPAHLRRAIPAWFAPSRFAPVPRAEEPLSV